jgi:hypothetical protein
MVWHLLQDLGQIDGTVPTLVSNDNRGCLDWTKGVSVSKKLCHMNMRGLVVRLAQTKGDVNVRHIEGKLFTKEIKDSSQPFSTDGIRYHYATPCGQPRAKRLSVEEKGGVESQSPVTRQEVLPESHETNQHSASTPNRLIRLVVTRWGTI